MRGRHFFGELCDRVRRAHARDHVFALGVDQIFAVKNFLAARWIASERDAGRARVAHVAEDHRLDVDRCAPVVGNPVFATINNARSLFHEPKTAPIEPQSWARASCGNDLPVRSLINALKRLTSSIRSSTVN